jgi:hypothetical protein
MPAAMQASHTPGGLHRYASLIRFEPEPGHTGFSVPARSGDDEPDRQGQAQSNTLTWRCGPHERQTAPTTHWIGRVVSAHYADTGHLGVADVWCAAVVSDDANESFWERHALLAGLAASVIVVMLTVSVVNQVIERRSRPFLPVS